MLRATSVLRKAAVKAERVVDTLPLGHRDRSINGVSVRATGGLEFAISLEARSARGEVSKSPRSAAATASLE